MVNDNSAPIYKLIATLNRIRKSGGTWFDSSITEIIDVEDNHLVFQRGPFVVVITNLLDSETAERSSSRRIHSSFDAETELTELIGCEGMAKTGDDGEFNIPSGLSMPQIWAPKEIAMRISMGGEQIVGRQERSREIPPLMLLSSPWQPKQPQITGNSVFAFGAEERRPRA